MFYEEVFFLSSLYKGSFWEYGNKIWNFEYLFKNWIERFFKFLNKEVDILYLNYFV